MKHVTIVIPNGYADLSSIAGSFEILSRANEHWQRMGNKPGIEIHIAGFVAELKLDIGCFSVYPASIKEITYTDLLIIPSVSEYYHDIIEKNKELILWISEQYKGGAE